MPLIVLGSLQFLITIKRKALIFEMLQKQILQGVLYALLCWRNVQCMTGTVENVFLNVRFSCLGQNKLLFKVTSEMQCVQRCLQKRNCGFMNYKVASEKDGDEKNCEVFQVGQERGSCSSHTNEKDWKAIVLKREKKVYENCAKVYNDQNSIGPKVSGSYHLKSGEHYCVLDELPGCGAGGWTLAMKVNGSKDTFASTSPYWTNNVTYNDQNGLKSFAHEEAKFPAFSAAPFQSICLGIEFAGATNWIRIQHNSTSLLDTFKDGAFIPTHFGRNHWKSLMSSGSLQENCNREGINVSGDDGGFYARIGIISNEFSDCSLPDSFIGVGIAKVQGGGCNLKSSSISSGNFATCSPDNGDKISAARGYILIQ